MVMAIVKQLDRRSGITYAYESKSYWDKEKKQSRSTRTLIGRVDPETGEIVPTDNRNRAKSLPSDRQEKRGRTSFTKNKRLFYGATYLFDQIGKQTGVTEDLKKCFPDSFKKILSIAYYLILEDRNPLSRFSKWAALHSHPFGEDIPSQRSSELFSSIKEEQKLQFFRLQGKRRAKEEYWAYDSTSISSYSEQLKQVRYGKNKDHEPLAQINLVLVYGQDSNLPFYYRKLAGNIPDVKTVKELVKELDVLGYSHVKLVMDRGFYSAENINAMFRNHYKFLIAVSSSLSLVKKAISEHGQEMRDFSHYDQNHDVYYFSKTVSWDYTQERPLKGDTINEDRRTYLHLFYSSEQAVEDERAFTLKMIQLQDELLSGNRVKEHEKSYDKYFTVTETPVRGIKVVPNQKAMDDAKKTYGFFAFLTNEVKDPITALELYRNRDVVEKAFGNIKDRLSGRRLLVSSNASLEGKLFVEFVALIYLSYIKKRMQEKKLFKDYTMTRLLDELDIIECFQQPGKEPFIGEILNRQKQLYLDLGFTPPENPASLC